MHRIHAIDSITRWESRVCGGNRATKARQSQDNFEICVLTRREFRGLI